jgi:hypothetical protein
LGVGSLVGPAGDDSGAELLEGGPDMTYVLNGLGEPLPCCWDECERRGHEQCKVVVRKSASDPGTSYVFCSERHRDYYRHSHRSFGNLPPGSKMLVR